MTAFYNDNDPYVCAWLQNLMDAGQIAPGTIDDRSILDLDPADLDGYERVHLFAGIGGWELALQWAGWRGPVWTGSCPCQPFSTAGQRRGADDERHLWPAFQSLIAKCRPPVVFGEQVASKVGRSWLAAVRADLEQLGYACGAADMPAAGIGAPHIRQRLWWVAHADRERQDGEAVHAGRWRSEQAATDESWSADRLAHADGRNASAEGLQRGGEHGLGAEDGGAGGRMEDPHSGRREASQNECARRFSGRTGGMGDANGKGRSFGEAVPREASGEGSAGAGQGHWLSSTLIPCADGKARPTEPSIHPLAHGIPNRMGRLRAYGNAIVPQVAAAFVQAFLESAP